MQKTVFIYALNCPLSGLPRYIGKSSNPESRFQDHFCSRETCHRANWIRSLRAKGLRPALEILDEVSEEHWQQWEVAYIEFFREQGHQLVNSTLGGDGIEMTAETRAKIAAAHLGKKRSPEACERIRASKSGEKHPMFGKKHPLEVIAKQRAIKLGKKRSLESRAKQSAARLGTKHSPEHCSKIAASHRGKKSIHNTSGFVGVCWDKRRGNWLARLCGKYLGGFSKLEDAVFVHALAFDKYYGNK